MATVAIGTLEPNFNTAEAEATIPSAEINVSRPSLFQKDTVGLFFERLRREDPVHYCVESRYRAYWSVTKFDDIVAVDTNHKAFSSEAKLGGISIEDMYGDQSELELESSDSKGVIGPRPR